MKLEKIDKKEEGKFITRYDITYKTVDDTTKNYKMKCERYLNESAFRTFFCFKQ